MKIRLRLRTPASPHASPTVSRSLSRSKPPAASPWKQEPATQSTSPKRRLKGEESTRYASPTTPAATPHITPETLGRELLEGDAEVVINLSCKDYNRNALEGRLWSLSSLGFRNVLMPLRRLPG